MNLTVKIVTPKELLYEGEASSVSSKNSLGNFDILPEHANFITLVNKTKVIIRPVKKGEKKVFEFDLAILHCTNNTINIYTDIIEADFLTNISVSSYSK